jgi:hypothetical protein
MKRINDSNRARVAKAQGRDCCEALINKQTPSVFLISSMLSVRP